MKIRNCPGCLRPGHRTYCVRCRKELFDGKPVSHILSFSRPEYNRRKLLHPERLSISGIQTKHSLKLEDSVLSLVQAGGEYILKPVPFGAFENLGEVPANEHLSMQLARQVFRIDTAGNGLIFFSDGQPAYLTKRFDVLPGGRKLLQEDFAQVAQKSEESNGPNYKYDFSYEEIGDLMKKYVKAYPIEVERYFTLVLYNYLIQNGDAHLKNFSLLRSEEYGDYHLSPAYDLLNTRLHVPVERDTALELFKDDFMTESYAVNGKYCRDDFIELGKRLGMREERIVKIIDIFSPAILDRVTVIIDRSFLDYGNDVSGNLRETYMHLLRERIERFGGV